MSYNIFVRNWWKLNPAWPDGREPAGGARKHYLRAHNPVRTEGEAQDICQEYNRTHKPGKLSRKAEYEEN